MAEEQCDLTQKKCKPCEGGVAPMNEDAINTMLKEVSGWEFVDGEITRTFTFKNYYQTMAFVNALAYIAHAEDHHPDIEVGYKSCKVRFMTHSIGGLSENDFICAAKIDALVG